MKKTKLAPADAVIRVVIYARISLDRDGNELGVTRQLDESREFCKRRGFVVVEEYVDNDISATKGKRREGFETILAEHAGTGVAVVCWHVDRFVRLTSDLERVIDAGLTVYGVHAGDIDLSTPSGRAVARTITAWATYEGEQKSIRQRASHIQSRRNGQPFHGGSRPFGYDKAVINGVRTYTVNQSEADYVRAMYQRFLDGHSLMSIAAWLNDEGIASAYDPKNKDGERPGFTKWKHTSVRQLLVQPRYAGIVTYQGEEIGEGNWTQLVSEATFRATVRQLEDPNRLTGGPRMGRNGLVHPLIGVIECGVCQSRATRFKPSPKAEEVYQCPQGHGSMHKAWIEDIVDAQVLTRLTTPVSRKQARKADVDVDSLLIELNEARNYADELGKALGARAMTLKQFSDANVIVQADIARLENALATAGLDEVLVKLMQRDDLNDAWVTMHPREKNKFLRAFYEKIVLIPRGPGKAQPGECRGHAILVTRERPEAPWEVEDEPMVFNYSPAEARAWCREQGYPVPAKGRIALQYRLAHEQAMVS